jgi:stage II sporulation protein D
MNKKMIAIYLFLILLTSSRLEASTIKVLILDDVFQNIPEKNEQMEQMGKLSGDLFVSGIHYSGDIAVLKSKAGMYLINELPIEEYVKNVVATEVSSSWDMEALKVQAVISRTYALYQKTMAGNSNFDLTSSVLHQAYKGSTVDARIAYAVMNTEGEVLYYDGKLIEALYHSTSGGKTEEASEVFAKSYPYLKPVESNCEISPYWMWERKIPVDEIEKALSLTGVTEIKITSYTTTKRVKTVDVIHSNGAMKVKATDLRKLLGWSRLPSTNFEVSRDNGNFVFEGKGYGHGVGLCQWSALQMAREGKNYKEILSYFYPGTVIMLYEDR